jgi:hypothetical protein
MDVPAVLRTSIAGYRSLGQWDRADLGRSWRRLGLSYGEIMEPIPVPKRTLAGRCRKIRLSDEQAREIKVRTGSRLGVPRDTQRKRRLQVQQIQAEAHRFALDHIGDPFWVAGTVRNWGEGSKTKRRLPVANADPALLQLFIGWTRRFHHSEAAFVLALHFHEGNDEAGARQQWQTGLGVDEFTKSFITPSGTGHRKNHLRYGVCRVSVRRSADAWIRAMA